MQKTTIHSRLPPVAHPAAEKSWEPVHGAQNGFPQSLREATQEFESLLISQLFQSMRRTVPEGGLIGTGCERLFREFLDQEFARRVAFNGGLGLGEMLFRQLDGGSVADPVPSARVAPDAREDPAP